MSRPGLPPPTVRGERGGGVRGEGGGLGVLDPPLWLSEENPCDRFRPMVGGARAGEGELEPTGAAMQETVSDGVDSILISDGACLEGAPAARGLGRVGVR